MDSKHCVGCKDNFYNGNNEYGIKKCWLLDRAKLKVRFAIGINTPMGQKSGYIKVTKPSCYTKKGSVFLQEVPSYAK